VTAAKVAVTAAARRLPAVTAQGEERLARFN